MSDAGGNGLSLDAPGRFRYGSDACPEEEETTLVGIKGGDGSRRTHYLQKGKSPKVGRSMTI